MKKVSLTEMIPIKRVFVIVLMITVSFCAGMLAPAYLYRLGFQELQQNIALVSWRIPITPERAGRVALRRANSVLNPWGDYSFRVAETTRVFRAYDPYTGLRSNFAPHERGMPLTAGYYSVKIRDADADVTIVFIIDAFSGEIVKGESCANWLADRTF